MCISATLSMAALVKYVYEMELMAIILSVTKLMGYNFEILYRAGLENKAVYALSGIHDDAQLNVIMFPFLLDVGVVEKEVQFGTKL